MEGPRQRWSLRPLAPSFFARSSPVVARDLLGRLLVAEGRDDAAGAEDAMMVARIVETEAYQQDDPASHSFGGPRGRNLVMYGPPGRLYVYFTYGMHFCMNVVTGPAGVGSAVLLRAAEPLDGIALMAMRRGTDQLRLLCSGPARLTQAFGVGRAHNGLELGIAAGLWVAPGRPAPDVDAAAGPRVGIRRAVERPWRFWVRSSRFVSRAAVRVPGLGVVGPSGVG